MPLNDEDLFFRSRVCKLSRPYVDDDGRVRYEHNERLAAGERVKMADGGQEVTVIKERLIDLFTRQEMVEILVPRDGGTVDKILVAEKTLRRV